MTFDEAKLRGIDKDKLEDEQFYSYAHLRLVKLHEERARLFHEYAKMKDNHRQVSVPEKQESDTPKQKPVAKPAKMVKNKQKPQFTEAQLRIAKAVLDKEMKNK
jgi:hypothetical protein